MSETEKRGQRPKATLNLKAIAGADHMISPEADKYDFDSWYRNTIRELILYIQDLEAKVRSLKQEADENWRAAVGAQADANWERGVR